MTTLRGRLPARIPVVERRLDAAGVPTATHRVVAPDLPGHGASGPPDGALDHDRLPAWLDDAADDPAHERPAASLQAFRAALDDIPVPPSDRSRP